MELEVTSKHGEDLSDLIDEVNGLLAMLDTQGCEVQDIKYLVDDLKFYRYRAMILYKKPEGEIIWH